MIGNGEEDVAFESSSERPPNGSNANRIGEEEIVVSKTGGARVRIGTGEVGERAVGGAVWANCEGIAGAELGIGADPGAAGNDVADLFEKRRWSEGRLLLLIICGDVLDAGVGSCLKGGKERRANDFR